MCKEKTLLLILKETKKMIDHRTRLRKNEDLPLWGAPVLTKKSPCFKVHSPITREIMRSKDAQCGNNLKVV